MSSTFQAGFAGARSRDREARSTKYLRLRWESNDRVQHEELLQLSCATLSFETIVVQGLGSSHGDLPACTREATRNSRRAPGAEAANTGPPRQTFDVCLRLARRPDARTTPACSRIAVQDCCSWCQLSNSSSGVVLKLEASDFSCSTGGERWSSAQRSRRVTELLGDGCYLLESGSTWRLHRRPGEYRAARACCRRLALSTGGCST